MRYRPSWLPLLLLSGCVPEADRPELSALLTDRTRQLVHVAGAEGHHGGEQPSGFQLGRLIPGGGLVLVDHQSPQLWWVDAAGRVRTDVARSGEGPRELPRILHVGIGADSSVAVLTTNGVGLFSPDGRWLGDRASLPRVALGVVGGCRPGEWTVYGPSEDPSGPTWLTRYRTDSGRMIPVASTLARRRGIAGLGLGRMIGMIRAPDGALVLQWDVEPEGGLVALDCEGAARLAPGAATDWIRAHPAEVARWRRGTAMWIGAGTSAPAGMVRTSRGLLFAELVVAARERVVAVTRFTLIDSTIAATATVEGVALLADSDAEGRILILGQEPEPTAIVLEEGELLRAMGVGGP
jgi:hypothetical protein